jgi:hypothetical protein
MIHERQRRLSKTWPFFQRPSGFFFSETLQLWVLPFNLESGCLEYPSMLNLPLRPQLVDAV